MPHKQVLFRSAAREKILRGATQLREAAAQSDDALRDLAFARAVVSR
jgi:hypothetical protein